MTERLRILIHISNYFQTVDIMEKTLSDKNEPKRGRNGLAQKWVPPGELPGVEQFPGSLPYIENILRKTFIILPTVWARQQETPILG